MHRDRLLQLIESYRTRYPKEIDCVTRFISFVRENSDCFERSLSIGHVTGSAWLVNSKYSHVLLTHHLKLNRWLQLGGHADGNSNILESASREAYEESGLTEIRPVSKEIFDLDIHLIPERGNEAAHYHYDVRFAFEAVGEEEFKVSAESRELAWVPIQEISKYTSEESMQRMAQKWVSIH
jgi:8-oxo-dGTP pyrophosphatase MutT (NUDIX family)